MNGPNRWMAALAVGGVLAGITGAARGAQPPGPAASGARPTEAALAFFEAKVRPLLAERCFACHSSRVSQAGLRLDTPEGIRRGGEHGAILDPSKPESSRLLSAVRYAGPGPKMPPSGKLPDSAIELLVDWVRNGAALPAASPTGAAGTKKAPLGIEEGKRFWSFRPLLSAEPRPARLRGWARTRTDQYLLAGLERNRLSPAAPADRRTLLRRLTFDLTGLPPTPPELAEFEKDARPDAYPRAVERLLTSPHYGERWARHWLDLVRYCDIPEAWAQTDARPSLYRDWVVEALNRDLPYDEFVRRQLAADEMPGLPPEELAALGFIGLSPSYWKELKLAPDVIKTVVAEEWEERINTLGSTVLAQTIACARCHDHKFDPFTQRDYYALAGVFGSTRLVSMPLLPPAEARKVAAARDRVKELEASAKKLREDAGKAPPKREELQRQAEVSAQQAEALKRSTPHYDMPLAYLVDTAALEVLPDGPDRTKLVYHDDRGTDTLMQLRGNPATPGPTVSRGFPAVLTAGSPRVFSQRSGRRELAEALFRESAPLAARVIVNRVWRHHFGRGIVETPSNFGTQGDRPTHPELLDDLAARFIRNGWSLKWLHRELVLSAAYMQSAPRTGASVLRDPENRWLARMVRRRLEIEAWRDAVLSAAGTLDPKIGGPAEELGKPTHLRRTLYGVVRRRELNDLLRLFDFPDPTGHSPARFPTTTPLQQLYVMNGDFVGRQAAALAVRVRRDAGAGPADQVALAHELLYGRKPTRMETELACRFLAEGGEAGGAERWQQLAEVLLARAELAYVE